jgi:hypothetical protein
MVEIAMTALQSRASYYGVFQIRAHRAIEELYCFLMICSFIFLSFNDTALNVHSLYNRTNFVRKTTKAKDKPYTKFKTIFYAAALAVSTVIRQHCKNIDAKS